MSAPTSFLGLRLWVALLLTASFGHGLRAVSTIDPARLPPAGKWSPGIPGGIPTNYTQFCDVRVSIPGSALLAIGDGVTDDTAAINAALALCPNGQFVYLPAGNYRCNGSLGRQGTFNYDNVQHHFSIALKGAGTAQTKILSYANGDALFFQTGLGFLGNWPITSGNTPGSTSITVATLTPSLMAVGKWIRIKRLNTEAGAIHDASYMTDTTSQFVRVTNIAGNGPYTIQFTPALNEGYASDQVGIACSVPYRCGIEDLYIERMIEGASGNNISIYCGQECWVKGVESRNTRKWHIRLNFSTGCEVRQCYVHDAWQAGGDSGYGVGLFNYTGNTLVEDNIAVRCRHSYIMEYGGQNNVFGYNYSKDPINNDKGPGLANQLLTDYLMGDLILHGGSPRWNLFEGNVAATIKFDCVLGASDYNTGFRNRMQRKGLPPNPAAIPPFTGTYVAALGNDIQRYNYHVNLVGNLYEGALPAYSQGLRRLGTNQDGYSRNISNASNTNPIVFTVTNHGFVTGDFVTITGVLGNTNANVTNGTITRIDANNFSVDGVAGSGPYTSGGTAASGIDPQTQATLYLDGEHDIATATTTWASADHALPDSYYRTSKPAWFGTLAWPPFDPSNPGNSSTTSIPAAYRFVNGASPPTAPYFPGQIANIAVSAGGNATFSAGAEGFPTPTFQWKKNNVDLPGKTNATLVLTNIVAADSGSTYQVVATNASGSATSNNAVLTVNPIAPSITAQPPASQTVTVGTTVTLTVVASGAPAPSYQWRKNGATLSNGGIVSGATSATLTLTGVTSGDAGTYTVVVNNAIAPAATSNNAILVVNPKTVSPPKGLRVIPK